MLVFLLGHSTTKENHSLTKYFNTWICVVFTSNKSQTLCQE